MQTTLIVLTMIVSTAGAALLLLSFYLNTKLNESELEVNRLKSSIIDLKSSNEIVFTKINIALKELNHHPFKSKPRNNVASGSDFSFTRTTTKVKR